MPRVPQQPPQQPNPNAPPPVPFAPAPLSVESQPSGRLPGDVRPTASTVALQIEGSDCNATPPGPVLFSTNLAWGWQLGPYTPPQIQFDPRTGRETAASAAATAAFRNGLQQQGIVHYFLTQSGASDAQSTHPSSATCGGQATCVAADFLFGVDLLVKRAPNQ